MTGQRISKREKWAHEDLFKCVPPGTLRAALPALMGDIVVLLDSRKLY